LDREGATEFSSNECRFATENPNRETAALHAIDQIE
jgi:hypothetical protein